MYAPFNTYFHLVSCNIWSHDGSSHVVSEFLDFLLMIITIEHNYMYSERCCICTPLKKSPRQDDYLTPSEFKCWISDYWWVNDKWSCWVGGGLPLTGEWCWCLWMTMRVHRLAATVHGVLSYKIPPISLPHSALFFSVSIVTILLCISHTTLVSVEFFVWNFAWCFL